MLDEKTNFITHETRNIISKILEIDIDKITSEANLINDLGADSMLILEIMVALDKKFTIEIPEVEALQMTSLSKIVEIIARYQSSEKIR